MTLNSNTYSCCSTRQSVTALSTHLDLSSKPDHPAASTAYINKIMLLAMHSDAANSELVFDLTYNASVQLDLWCCRAFGLLE